MSLFKRIWELVTKTDTSNNDYYFEVDNLYKPTTEKMAVSDIVQQLGLNKSKLSITNGNEIDISDVELTQYERHGGRLFNEILIKPERITLLTDLKINIEGKIVYLKEGFYKLFRDVFAEGENRGGLDHAMNIENRMFDIYIIASTDLQKVDMLFVLEGESPIMPTGFSLKQFFSKYKTSYSYFGPTTGILIDKLYQNYEFSNIRYNEGKFKNIFVKNHINGFEISKESSTKIKIDIGQCRDFSDENNIFQNSYCYKTTGEFVQGNENGMFERPIEKETLYYIYILLGTDGRIDYIASTNFYDTFNPGSLFPYYRIVGYLRTDEHLDFVTWNWNDPQTFIATKKYTSGTRGGNTVVGYNLIDLNFVNKNTIPVALLENNRVFLPKGIYTITAKSAVYNILSYLVLRDETENEVTCSLTTDSTNSGITMVNSINCETELDGYYTLDLYSKTARTDGLGRPISITGRDEIFAGIMFNKLK